MRAAILGGRLVRFPVMCFGSFPLTSCIRRGASTLRTIMLNSSVTVTSFFGGGGWLPRSRLQRAEEGTYRYNTRSLCLESRVCVRRSSRHVNHLPPVCIPRESSSERSLPGCPTSFPCLDALPSRRFSGRGAGRLRKG